MEEKRFHREDYPLDILAEFGLTEEMIYDLPEFVHETLERGGKSPLLPICVEQPFGVTHAYAKFCLIETEEGLDVMFSPKLKSINLDAFSEEERQSLLSGKVIVAEVDDKAVTDEGVEEMQRIQAFVQLDRDTNGVIYTPTQVIGRNLNAVATEYELSGEDLNSFWKGGLVTLYEENRQGQKNLSLSVLTSLLIRESSSFQALLPNGRTRCVVSCQGIHSAMMDVGSIKTGDSPMFLKRSSPKTSLMSWSVLPNYMEWSARHMSYVMLFRNLTFTQTTQKKSNISLCDNIRNTSNTV